MLPFCQDLLLAFWATTLAMAPWLLFGFFVAGMLSLFFSPEKVSATLGRKAGKKAIWMAVLLGVPLPLCSCGVLPTALGLRKGGASKSATAAFLISTPQTGIDSFFATGSLLGWVFALTRPLVALFTGLVGGILVDTIDDEPPTTPLSACLLKGEKKGLLVHLFAALKYGFGTLFGNIAWPLILGILLSACITAFVPEALFNDHFLGNDWIAFPLMIVIGMPMYVCSTASIPIALSLMIKGISPGAALIFLIVGPALNGASLMVLLRLLGKRCMVIHLGVITLFAILAGFVLNLIHQMWQLMPTTLTCQCQGHGSAWLATLSAITLLTLLSFHLIHKLRKKVIPMTTSLSSAQTQQVTIKGMMCDHCRGLAKKCLSAYATVTAVEQISPDTFLVEGSLPETLADDIQALGFTLVQDK